MIITVQTRSTLTIPLELRRALHLEPGDPLEARIEGGSLILTPVAVVPRLWTLSAAGEAKEAEADQEVRAGRVRTFEDAADLLAHLEP
jgi:bifunctional DNA-binding transcriptional regulator/antitoxin component of YhaV-PrlF toxin-antitoxin module